MINSVEQAVAALQNVDLPEAERVNAVRFLQGHPTKQAIDALVEALDDDDHGVRWAAGTALAFIGEPAMPAILQALITPDTSRVLRDGVHHVIVDNSSPRVRAQCQDLLKALKGPQSGIASMEAALKLTSVFA
jgi:hypothetical protein